MARDAVTPGTITVNGGTAIATVPINTTNGITIPTNGNTRRLILVINNSGTVAGTVSVLPGAYPPAFEQGIGTISIAIAAGTYAYISLESARVVQSDGSISANYSTGMSGWATAYYLPNNV